MNTETFCRILSQRSEENTTAINLLLKKNLLGNVISILRQELDSLVRSVFLLNIGDLSIRNHYINQTVNNERWRDPMTNRLITDKDMVELTNQLYGWTLSVYKLGCAFIHLSPLLDYKRTNPFSLLSTAEKHDIKQHLNEYHAFSMSLELNIENVSPYLQSVFDKISGNLSCYIEDLKNNTTLSL